MEYAPSPVKLFIGVLYKERENLESIRDTLIAEFGIIDYESEEIEFKWTNYYEDELGFPLKRVFLSFSPLVSPDQIVEIKRITNRIEGEKRKVNLDPGYIEGGKLVLATTKDQAHRIYLGKGIYAEVTLRFRDGHFIPFDYTYPDYRSEEYHAIFSKIRSKYLEEVRGRFPPTAKLTTRWALKSIFESFSGLRALVVFKEKRDIIDIVRSLVKVKEGCGVLALAVKGARGEAEALSHIDVVDYVFPFKGALGEVVAFLKPDLLFLSEDIDLKEIGFYEGRVVRL